MKIVAVFILFFCSLTFNLSAQDTTDYFRADFIRYENHIYKPTVFTVVLERNTERLSEAIIALNSSQQLKLSFDDLQSESVSYSYKFIHCDFNWQPSQLHESDYTEGFFYESVSDYSPSFNTYQAFYHYSCVFPTPQMRITKSGNYIVMVFDNNEPDNPVITWRFRVFEPLVTITQQIHRATIAEYRTSHQEVDFTVDYSNYAIINPYIDLKIVLQQNARWDNAITNLKPLFMQDHLVDYNYEEGNLFNGGNEFRNFDTRTLRTSTPYVQSILQDSLSNTYQVKLRQDESRSYQRYSILDDIDGKYLVKIYDGRNDETEADYANVQFRLRYQEPLANGNFYVLGALTNWSFLPQSKMRYDYQNQEYTCSLFLKQGYYNYQYVWVDDAKKMADETIIEGNHYETKNEYFIFAYHRDPTSRYDRLIGFKKITSTNIY